MRWNAEKLTMYLQGSTVTFQADSPTKASLSVASAVHLTNHVIPGYLRPKYCR